MNTVNSIKTTNLEPIAESKMVDLLGGFSNNSINKSLTDNDPEKAKDSKSNKCDKCDKCTVCW